MGDPFKLIIEDDEGKRNVVPVDLGEVNVGRVETNAIRLNERNVSRSHMRLVKENGNVVAEDLNSYNGVFINGDRITQRQMIHEGDLIRVGDFHLELRGEGLTRRAEETTQKTLVPDLDSTQPGMRTAPKPHTEKIPQPTAQPPAAQAAAPAAQAQAPAPPPMAQQPAPAPVEAEATVPDEEEERHEPTAIIRMDQLQGLDEAGGGNKGVISGEKPKLICVSTSFAGKQFEISTAEAVIGRTSDNDVTVDHRSVSRHHAKIVAAGNGYKIVDMGSANGTLVNGEQYAQLALKLGDVIELGHVKFRFVPPGGSYTFTEEEEAAIRGETPKAGGSTATADAGGGSAGGGIMGAIKANPFGAIGAGAAVVALLIVLVLVLGRNGGDTPEVEPVADVGTAAVTETIEVPPDQLKASGPGAKWIERALKAMGDKDWRKAERYANKALDKDPDNDGILDLLDSIENERARRSTLRWPTRPWPRRNGPTPSTPSTRSPTIASTPVNGMR